MFKKFFLLIVLSFSVLFLVACDDPEEVERTYKADGVYTAFEAELTKGNGPQYTWVSVTIENDQIVSYFIDCLQSRVTKRVDDEPTGLPQTFAFNEKSKKELGYYYGMHNTNNAALSYTRQDLTTQAGYDAYLAFLAANDKKEWFEQAAIIEAHFLANGPELQVNEEKYIQNLAGVTVADGNYSKLAKQAVENAKAGVTYVLVSPSTGSDIIWVKAEVDSDGKFTSLELNTLQGRVTEGKFAWDAQTKQQKGYLYGMHNVNKAAIGYTKQTLTTTEGMNAYKAMLDAQNLLEWFEQANLITDYVLANGLSNVKVGENRKLENPVQALTGVTIYVDSYHKVLTTLYTNFPQ